jgi:hypothetical protein
MKTEDMQIHLPEMNTRLWVSILMREMSHVNSLLKPFTIHDNAQFAVDVVLGLFLCGLGCFWSQNNEHLLGYSPLEIEVH